MADKGVVDADVMQDLLAQQQLSLQKVLAFNFEVSSRLSKTRKMPEDVEGVDSGSQDRIRRAEAAADRTRTECTSLKQEMETLRIALATARAEASEAKSHAANTQLSTYSRSSKEDGKNEEQRGGVFSFVGGSLSALASPLSAISARGLGEPLLQDSDTENEAHKAAKERKRGSILNPIFPDVDKMRRDVQAHLTKEEYNVEDFYKETGFAQAIARNPNFKNMAFVVIALNTIWIAIDTDCNKFDLLTDAPAWLQIGENAFCVFFVFEILMRFLSFKRKCNMFSDSWMMFDSVLVALMVWETWMAPTIMTLGAANDTHTVHDMTQVGTCPSFLPVLMPFGATGGIDPDDPHGAGGGGGSASSIFRVFRLFRLTRVARLARLLNGMPELMVLIKGMLIAIRSVVSTLLLLVIIIYVFAILLTQMLSGSTTGQEQKFETVPQSMNTLLLQGVFPDQGDAINALLAESLSYYFILLIYLVVGSLTVMNMLIGVICEVVTVVAQVEKEEAVGGEIKARLAELLPELDTDGDGKISWKEFQAIVSNPLAIQTLDEVGIACLDLVECGPMIFSAKDPHAKNHEDTSIGMEDFIGAVLKFKGDNPATLKDLFEMKTMISKEMTKQLSHFHKTDV